MGQSLIDLVHITKSFDGDIVLDDLNLSVKENTFVTLLGPSGCGKTTTLRIIGGFEKADSGKVIFDGQDIGNIPPNKRQLNTVFQKYALFPHMTVAANIGYSLKLKKRPKDEIKKAVDDALALVQLSGYGKRMPAELSGGQRQRVAIARAVVANPKLILADEPTGNLDSKNGQEVMNLLSELNKEGTTIVMVTHSQHDAGFASRTINLFDGQVVTETLI